MIERNTLPNGLRVVSERMEHYRSVSMGVWVDAGSVCETAAESGASHFIEHMLFKGTASRSAAAIAAEMDAIGGNLNAFTAKECTCFYFKVLDERLEQAADVLSDLLLHSRFDSEDIAREKGVVSEEILMTADSPEDVAHESLCALLFEGTPLERPILGTQETVGSFTRESLMDYMGRHYRADNIVISCAGSFQADKLLQVVSDRFMEVPAGGKRVRAAGNLGPGRRMRMIEKDVEQIHICLGLPGFAVNDDRRFAMMVLNNALGGCMSSRLFQKIREERGLAYSIYSYPTSYADTGYFTLYAGTAADTAETVTGLMLEELAQLRKNGLEKEEFTRAKEQIRDSYILGQESTSARSSALGKAELLLGEVSGEGKLLEKLDRVSMEDVEAILPAVLEESALCGTMVGKLKKTKAAGIEKLITGK